MKYEKHAAVDPSKCPFGFLSAWQSGQPGISCHRIPVP